MKKFKDWFKLNRMRLIIFVLAWGLLSMMSLTITFIGLCFKQDITFVLLLPLLAFVFSVDKDKINLDFKV